MAIGGKWETTATAGNRATCTPAGVRIVNDVRINRGWDRTGTQEDIDALRNQMKGTVAAPRELPPPPRPDRLVDHPQVRSLIGQGDRPPEARAPDVKGKPRSPGSPGSDSPPSMERPSSQGPATAPTQANRPDPGKPAARPAAPEPRKPQQPQE
jgi:hypothetical protein